MPPPVAAALLLLCTAHAAAQAPGAAADRAHATRPDPVALVAQAEKQLGKKDADVEASALLLWQALDELAAQPASTVRDATAMSARFLLQQHDPREANRRKAFAAVAKQQVDLATAYRLKKWLDTASERADVAERFDRDAVTKERAAIAAARPKDKPPTAKAAADAPKQAAEPSLLQKAQAEFVVGSWTESDGTLRLAPLTPDAAAERVLCAQVEAYAYEAMGPFVTIGLATSVAARAERNGRGRIALTVTLTRIDEAAMAAREIINPCCLRRRGNQGKKEM